MPQQPIYSAEEEQLLMSKMWSPAIKNDPERFVLFTYPWGVPGTPLEKFKGPRLWQRKFLRKIRDQIAINTQRLVEASSTPSSSPTDDQLDEVLLNAVREAIASGRGIGKSALVAWLIDWMMTTRIGSSTIVSANSESQLRSVTWAELIKWVAMSINSHWWDISATKMVPAKWLADLVEKDLKKGTRYWAAEGKLWSEENPDSYAGPHNYDGMMVIFDEASGIPDPIWSVAAGFFTENTPHRFWLAFSNPRRSNGYFYECFHSKSEFWGTENINALTVEGVDKAIYEQIINEYGSDSDQAKIEVYGEFPDMGSDEYISVKSVDEAMGRAPYDDLDIEIVMGVDPGKGKPDPCLCCIRRGRDVLDFKELIEDDPEELEMKILNYAEEYDCKTLVVDEGGLGWALCKSFKKSGYKIIKINSAWKSSNPVVWGNKRAEMWAEKKKF